MESEKLPPAIRVPSRRDAMGCILAWAGWHRISRAAGHPAPSSAVSIGQPLRDGALAGLNGPSHRLSDFRGHPLIINVWASWCGPCRQEMASLERLAWRGDARAFDIIGISTDDDPAAARRLLASTNATIAHFIDQHLYWETLLGASRIPLTLLVASDGTLLRRVYGAQQWDGAEAQRLIARDFDAASR